MNLNANENATTTHNQAKKIYREGILPSEKLMSAIVQSDVELQGNLVACANCHRRSALGTTEGNLVMPPITSNILFQPKTLGRKDHFMLKTKGIGVRPAYTNTSLKQAIRKGIDSSGRTLDPLMPRYDLSDSDSDILIAYMKTLGISTSLGITDSDMHFATIVAEKANEAQKKAMIDVLEKFFMEKNAGTRHETRRAKHAPWHRDWKYQAYRNWKLHIWELKGEPVTWLSQLEQYYSQQPVFAMLSGLTQGNWQPIHTFCEANEIPCLFPNTNQPVISETDYYTFYFSQGVILEANVLTKYLVNHEKPKLLNNIIQIYRLGSEGEIAATHFREKIHSHNIKSPLQIALKPLQKIDTSFWRQLMKNYPDSIIAIWLEQSDFSTMTETEKETNAINGRWYISATLNPDWSEAIPKAFKNIMSVISPFAQPARLKRRLRASNTWLKSRKILSEQIIIQANTYFTMRAVGRTIMHLRDNFSRDYFIELLEHEVEKMLVSSVFPRMALGPSQRYASKGAYIINLSTLDNQTNNDWIVP